MSNDSSSTEAPQVRSIFGWGVLDGIVLWLIAFRGPQYFVGEIAHYLTPILPQVQNVKNAMLYIAAELLTIGLVAMFMRLYKWRLADVGLGGFKLNFLPKILAGYFVYFVLSFGLIIVARLLQINVEEEQDVGFTKPQGIELLLSFVTLVILVPFTEELLFRGFLFKVLRGKFDFIVTTMVVSVVFALVHGLVGVGLDVFALSLVLCYLREHTGSLWPAVILHSTKNAVAFFILFIYNVQ